MFPSSERFLIFLIWTLRITCVFEYSRSNMHRVCEFCGFDYTIVMRILQLWLCVFYLAVMHMLSITNSSEKKLMSSVIVSCRRPCEELMRNHHIITVTTFWSPEVNLWPFSTNRGSIRGPSTIYLVIHNGYNVTINCMVIDRILWGNSSTNIDSTCRL